MKLLRRGYVRFPTSETMSNFDFSFGECKLALSKKIHEIPETTS
jgi:hypothetical protein